MPLFSKVIAGDGEFFGLKIQGDSMEPCIYDGDVNKEVEEKPVVILGHVVELRGKF